MSRRKRQWVFTLNNYTQDEFNAMQLVDTRFLQRMKVAREVGESGTLHLQGVVSFVNARTLTGVKRFLGSNRYHLEPMRGTAYEAYSYPDPEHEEKSPETCEVVFTFGDMPLEAEQDLSTWEQILQCIDDGWTTTEIIRRWPGAAMRCISAIEKYRFEVDWKAMEWRNVETIYLSGATGIGKTRYVMEKYGYHNVYRVVNKKHPWDGYNGEDVVIFEEFRNSFKIEDMLNWLDGYPLRLPARYADKCAKFTKVFILSNWDFYEQYEKIQEDHNETWMAWSRRIGQIWSQEQLEAAKAAECGNEEE